MAEDRIRIQNQLEKSAVKGSVIVTNEAGESFYLPPGDNATVFTIVGQVPTWQVSAAGTKHAHVMSSSALGTGSPMAGWTQPVGAAVGDTVVVKYTDHALGFFSYDGVSWVFNFSTNEEIREFPTLLAANTALGLGKIFRYTENNQSGLFGLDVTH